MKPFTFVLALVLATCQMPLRNSEARPWDALHCGRTDLAHLPAKYFLGETCSAPCDGQEHFFDLKKTPIWSAHYPKAQSAMAKTMKSTIAASSVGSLRPRNTSGSRTSVGLVTGLKIEE